MRGRTGTLIRKSAFVAIAIGSHYLRTETTFEALVAPPKIAELHLSQQQLRENLGIGNREPVSDLSRLMPYDAWKGWSGAGRYEFRAAYLTTPYLTEKQQLNNWNEVIFNLPRRAAESKYEAEPASREIKEAVDRRLMNEKANPKYKIVPNPDIGSNRRFLRRKSGW